MTATDTTIAARIHTAETALPLITQWDADNADDQEACIWNDLLYWLPGVDQELSDNELIAFTDGSRLEWTRDGWDAHPPEGGTPGTAEKVIEDLTDEHGEGRVTTIHASTDGSHFETWQDVDTFAAGGVQTNTTPLESGWSGASAEELLRETLNGFDC